MKKDTCKRYVSYEEFQLLNEQVRELISKLDLAVNARRNEKIIEFKGNCVYCVSLLYLFIPRDSLFYLI